MRTSFLLLLSSLFFIPTLAFAEGPEADLSITKSATVSNEGKIERLEEIEFVLNYENLGPDTATSVEVTDYYSGNVHWIIFDYPKNCSVRNTHLLCDVGTLQSGEKGEITYKGKVSAGADLLNTTRYATIRGNEYDPNESNNTQRLRYQVVASEYQDFRFSRNPAFLTRLRHNDIQLEAISGSANLTRLTPYESYRVQQARAEGNLLGEETEDIFADDFVLEEKEKEDTPLEVKEGKKKKVLREEDSEEGNVTLTLGSPASVQKEKTFTVRLSAKNKGNEDYDGAEIDYFFPAEYFTLDHASESIERDGDIYRFTKRSLGVGETWNIEITLRAKNGGGKTTHFAVFSADEVTFPDAFASADVSVSGGAVGGPAPTIASAPAPTPVRTVPTISTPSPRLPSSGAGTTAALFFLSLGGAALLRIRRRN